MALRNYNTREENEMQDLTQKQIDLAGFSEKGFSQEQINQIYEYAQMVGDELKVRNLIWSIAGANDQSDQERIVQLMEDARKEMEIYPDSEVTMSALHGYGYLADDMYPLSKEAALDLHMRGLKIYCLQTDGTKSVYASREMIQEHEGLFGVEKRVWDALEEDEPVYTEDIEPLHDPMTVIDKGPALKYYDAGATIYLITPFSQLIAASERMEIERGADHFQLSVYEQTLLQDLETEMENHPQLQSLKEARLLLGNEHRYGIYQFKEGSFAETYAFMNMNYIMDHNITIHKEDYHLVYSAEMLPSDSLDGLYERFNIDRPRDFTGHSMSVGDIIVVNDEGKLTEIIEGYREDIAHYEAHKITDPEAFEMEIGGKIFTEKKEAGAALLAVCKQIQSVNEAKDVGNYQGFHMMARFDSWNKEFILSVKHTAVSSLPLGSDPLGNIARINNLLESYPKKLADAEQKLETVKEQLENAKQEVVKPFPKEKELNRMMERLSELNALLNMDEQGSSEEPENSGKQSIHDKLNAIKQKGQQEHDHDKTAKGNDIDCS